MVQKEVAAIFFEIDKFLADEYQAKALKF